MAKENIEFISIISLIYGNIKLFLHVKTINMRDTYFVNKYNKVLLIERRDKHFLHYLLLQSTFS